MHNRKMHEGVGAVLLAAGVLMAGCSDSGNQPRSGASTEQALGGLRDPGTAPRSRAPGAGTSEEAVRTFIGALRARDLELATAMLITVATCTALANHRVEQCSALIPRLRAGLGDLLEVVDTDYTIGLIAQDEKTHPGIHVFQVTREGGGRPPLVLITAKHEGRHRIAWPIKVEKAAPASPPVAPGGDGPDDGQLETAPPAPPSSATQAP